MVDFFGSDDFSFSDKVTKILIADSVGTGTLTESALGPSLSGPADSGTLAESASFSVAQFATDTGTLAERASITVTLVAADTATLAEPSADVAQSGNDKIASDSFSFSDKRTQVNIADTVGTGTLSEGVAPLGIGVTASEAFTVAETGSVSSPPGLDNFTLGDDTSFVDALDTTPDLFFAEASFQLDVAQFASDTAALAESGAVTVPLLYLTASDTFALGEATSLSTSGGGVVVDQTAFDAFTLADNGVPTLPFTGADSATLAEAVSLTKTGTAPSDNDTAVLGESVQPIARASTVSDSGTFVEDGVVLIVQVVATDAGTVTDILNALLASVSDADGAALSERESGDFGYRGALRATPFFAVALGGRTNFEPALGGAPDVES